MMWLRKWFDGLRDSWIENQMRDRLRRSALADFTNPQRTRVVLKTLAELKRRGKYTGNPEEVTLKLIREEEMERASR